MKNINFIVVFFLFSILYAQNQVPQIENISLNLNSDSTLNINYDLLDAENDACTISFLVSDNGGMSFEINTSDASGDVAEMITPGTNKLIVWDYSNVIKSSSNYTIKLIANDLYEINIQDIVDQVDINRLSADLATITGVRHRTSNPKHLGEVRNLIKDRFTSNIGNVVTQEFDFRSYKGQNFISTHLGNNLEKDVYILDAHYDGVANTPGADDNGSGTAGMLEAARILSQYQFKRTIRFIGFDLEESGLVGSRAYANQNAVKNENILGVLNFESIGFFTDEPNSQTLPSGFNFLYPQVYADIQKDSFKGNFIANIGVENQNDWELEFLQAAQKYVPELKVVTFAAPANWSSLTPDLARSDHAAFWEINKPAVMLSGTANFRNKNYHTANDTLGSINFDFITQIVKAAVATLAEKAEIQHSSIAMKDIQITLDAVQDVQKCNFVMYPNPVVDYLNISFENCPQGKFDLKIYNVNGSLMINKEISNSDQIQLNITDWSQGEYIIEYGAILKRFVK